jgi:hypothetical protein
MDWKSNHRSKIDWETGHGHEVAIASFWLLLRYDVLVPHSPWKKGKAGDNRCYSNFDTKNVKVLIVKIDILQL